MSIWVVLCDWGVLCVTSCTVSPSPPPSFMDCGGKGKLLPGHVPRPEWSFRAVTVTVTYGT